MSVDNQNTVTASEKISSRLGYINCILDSCK